MHEWPELKGGPDPVNWGRIVWIFLVVCAIGFAGWSLWLYLVSLTTEANNYPQIEHAKPLFEDQQIVQSTLTGEKMQVLHSSCYINECTYEIRVRSEEGFHRYTMKEFELQEWTE